MEVLEYFNSPYREVYSAPDFNLTTAEKQKIDIDARIILKSRHETY